MALDAFSFVGEVVVLFADEEWYQLRRAVRGPSRTAKPPGGTSVSGQGRRSRRVLP